MGEVTRQRIELHMAGDVTPEFHLRIIEEALNLLSDFMSEAQASTDVADAISFSFHEAPLAMSEAKQALIALRNCVGVR